MLLVATTACAGQALGSSAWEMVVGLELDSSDGGDCLSLEHPSRTTSVTNTSQLALDTRVLCHPLTPPIAAFILAPFLPDREVAVRSPGPPPALTGAEVA
jgi:hypothetical protein